MKVNEMNLVVMKRKSIYSKNRVGSIIKIISVLLCFIVFSGIFPQYVDAAKHTPVVSNEPSLKFDSDGKFKIIQFADIQDGPETSPQAIALMNSILDAEKPDLVILTGDNVDGNLCATQDQMKKAISNIAQPMETRKIPWAIVFGNHDDEGPSGMTKQQIMNYYMSFPYNISQIGATTDGRVGNYNLLVKGSETSNPVFNFYFLDSGAYAQGGYGYITTNQINWYKKTAALYNKKNTKIPALMFFHIPLQEYFTAYTTQLLGGDRLENECPQSVNTHLFDAIIQTGDVKGVFAGHDHLNSYWAKLKGVILGYGGSISYRSYYQKDIPRKAITIEISENNLANFTIRVINEF